MLPIYQVRFRQPYSPRCVLITKEQKKLVRTPGFLKETRKAFSRSLPRMKYFVTYTNYVTFVNETCKWKTNLKTSVLFLFRTNSNKSGDQLIRFFDWCIANSISNCFVNEIEFIFIENAFNSDKFVAHKFSHQKQRCQ